MHERPQDMKFPGAVQIGNPEVYPDDSLTRVAADVEVAIPAAHRNGSASDASFLRQLAGRLRALATARALVQAETAAGDTHSVHQLASSLLRDFLIPEGDCNSEDFESIYGRYTTEARAALLVATTHLPEDGQTVLAAIRAIHIALQTTTGATK